MEIVSEFLTTWGIYIEVVATAILVYIAWKKVKEVEELEEALVHQVWTHSTLDTAHRKSKSRCADLTIIVNSLESELDELKRKTHEL